MKQLTEKEKKELQAKIAVLTEVNEILKSKRDEFQRLIDNNETSIRLAEEVLNTKK